MAYLPNDGVAAAENGGQMNEELQDLIESANVLAEILKLHYDSFVNAGFSKGQAMDLTLAVMDNMYEDMEDE